MKKVIQHNILIRRDFWYRTFKSRVQYKMIVCQSWWHTAAYHRTTLLL